MKILITGICGFVGNIIARALLESSPKAKITGIDNLVRPGSELNRHALRQFGISVFHADIRNPSDLESLTPCDWIIDAAANPTVMAGVDDKTSSRQLIEHNLIGTINLLELCKTWSSGFIMLSTSRVYSIQALSELKMEVKDNAYSPSPESFDAPGMTKQGITEDFSTQPPLSFYGTSKSASELLVLEYGNAFDIPVFVNRSGVMAGSGQFGRSDQGIFSFWIHSYCHQKPLKYIGFNG
ncbi:NAD-dependent epimerase/dehydratase family protein, partial [Verrucomicrobiota bacterium]